eukprot:5624778-Pleurochrysis_carterae.AAC.1
MARRAPEEERGSLAAHHADALGDDEREEVVEIDAAAQRLRDLHQRRHGVASLRQREGGRA